MRLPARSLGALTKRRFTTMKPWRNTREAKTGSATNGNFFAANRLTYSELDIFANVEFQPAGHAVEDLPRTVDDKKIEVDAIRFDVARVQRQHSVVETASEGDRQ